MDTILRKLESAGVRFLLLGGQAVRLAGSPRFSLDWDFFVPPRDLQNCARINEALASDLDGAVESLGPRGEHFIQTFQTEGGIIQFHLLVPGLPDFNAAYRRAIKRVTENGTSVLSLSPEDLLLSKRAANRPSDQQDIQFLEILIGMQRGETASPEFG